ncbi:MAG TPA: glutathione S-transferase N-terminal domain-containing protein [Rhodanobacteraceae bacterium]|nr:glutathione S-transferase N-terminal domain-containing protein [Rhodanobacteraceae bacterium]
MKLYSFAGSCALGTHIVLEWIGKPFDIKMVQKDDLKQPEMLKLNPNHQVPILDDDGWVLVENAAILNYLADKFPEAKLGGDGSPRSRAEVNRWLAMLNSDVHPAFKPLFGATNYLDDKAAIEKTHANARRVLRKYFEEFDAQLGKHDWLAGSRSIADPYLFVVLRWAKGVKVDLAGLDNLRKFEKHMRADAGVQRALKAQGLDQAKAA